MTGGVLLEVIRADKMPQIAGAYYVRIQAMARKYHITLEKEFDSHDSDGTKYIVITDDDFPVATCRFFETAEDTVEIGRVVVLEEYRGRGLGALSVREAEKWITELGYRKISVESRVEAVGFYEKLGYRNVTGALPKAGDTFVCVHMEKNCC